jgi:DNA-binding CsgD family transcriptional regulator
MTALSPREREIVEHVGKDGVQYVTVAHRLGISIHTVRTYVYRVAKRIPGFRSPREKLIELYHRECIAPNGDARGSDV